MRYIKYLIFSCFVLHSAALAQGIPGAKNETKRKANEDENYACYKLSRVATYLSTPAEFSSSTELRPPFPRIEVEFAFPEKKRAEMERELKHWKYYTEYISDDGFKILRGAIQILLFNHYKLAKKLNGKYIFTAIAWDGKQLISNDPYFPTKYRMEFLPSGMARDKAVFLYDISVTADANPDDGKMTKETFMGYMDKMIAASQGK